MTKEEYMEQCSFEDYIGIMKKAERKRRLHEIRKDFLESLGKVKKKQKKLQEYEKSEEYRQKALKAAQEAEGLFDMTDTAFVEKCRKDYERFCVNQAKLLTAEKAMKEQRAREAEDYNAVKMDMTRLLEGREDEIASQVFSRISLKRLDRRLRTARISADDYLKIGSVNMTLEDYLLLRLVGTRPEYAVINDLYKPAESRSIYAYMRAYLMQLSPAVKNMNKHNPQLLTRAAQDAARDVLSFDNTVCLSMMMDLLQKTTTYKNLRSEVQKKERSHKQEKKERDRLRRMILKEIPDRIPDLYPLAREIKRHFILHIGPTNSGKTYQALERLKKAETGIYLSPLRLLAYEVFDRLNHDGVICEMITGEEEILVPGSTHTSSTVETLDIYKRYDVAVIDECQMIADSQRGGAWTRAVLGVCAPEIHICCDNSCRNIVTQMITDCGDDYEEVIHERSVPLLFDKKDFRFPDGIQEKDALIVFSKRSVLAVAAELQRIGISASVIYGKLPYDVRMNEVKKFTEGKTSVVVSTDAIGMGLNLPIRRIVFLETEKFDGIKSRNLTPSEIKQIAGRAGRRGIFEKGYFTSEYSRKLIRTSAFVELEQIEKVRLGIPESITSIEKPISEILERWVELPDQEYYKKEDIKEQMILARKLEQITDDKEIIYGMVTTPYDSKNDVLTDLLMILTSVETGRRDDLSDIMAIYMAEGSYDEVSLEELERLYSTCDLLFRYAKKFNHDDYLERITENKRLISERIIAILNQQHLPVRKCSRCGRQVPWNYPYNMCERCFNASRGRF
ncbi:MAG: helicase [Lachnospiraceae bacterium]|nr:helicase [Lachnospiraceae bacterium]